MMQAATLLHATIFLGYTMPCTARRRLCTSQWPYACNSRIAKRGPDRPGLFNDREIKGRVPVGPDLVAGNPTLDVDELLHQRQAETPP